MRFSSEQIATIKQRATHLRVESWSCAKCVSLIRTIILRELQAAGLDRAYVAADRLIEILHHIKGYAARYDHV